MRAFRDKLNREWIVDVSVGSLRRVKDLAKINLLDDPATEIERVFQSTTAATDVAWELIRPEATRLGVDQDGFLDALDERALLALREAVIDELLDFFHQRLPALAKIVEALRKVETAAVEVLTRKMPRIESVASAQTAKLDRKLDEAIDKAMAEANGTATPGT